MIHPVLVAGEDHHEGVAAGVVSDHDAGRPERSANAVDEALQARRATARCGFAPEVSEQTLPIDEVAGCERQARHEGSFARRGEVDGARLGFYDHGPEQMNVNHELAP